MALNKSGFVDTRNKSRAYRAVRMIDKDGVDQPHPMDMMVIGNNGKMVNATGCFGQPSTFGIRVKTYGPKKGRRKDKKAKKVARTFSNGQQIRAKAQVIPYLIRLRGKLLTLRTVGDFLEKDFLGQHLGGCLVKLSERIFLQLNPAEVAQVRKDDVQREKSVMGRLIKDGPNRVFLDQLTKEVDHAIRM